MERWVMLFLSCRVTPTEVVLHDGKKDSGRIKVVAVKWVRWLTRGVFWWNMTGWSWRFVRILFYQDRWWWNRISIIITFNQPSGLMNFTNLMEGMLLIVSMGFAPGMHSICGSTLFVHCSWLYVPVWARSRSFGTSLVEAAVRAYKLAGRDALWGTSLYPLFDECNRRPTTGPAMCHCPWASCPC